MTLRNKVLLTTLLLCLYALTGLAQAPCDQENFTRVIKLAQEDSKAGKYRRAVARFQAAARLCPDRQEEVDGYVRETFNRVERERDAARAALRRAEQAENARKKAEERAELANMKVKTFEQISRSVIGSVDFYEDKFGLITPEKGNGRDYTFVDPNGTRLFGRSFSDAEAFNNATGYAQVTLDNKSYLLDTTGNILLLAQTIRAISPQTEALDFTDNPTLLDKIDPRTCPRVKVIIAQNAGPSGNYLSTLPKAIFRLTALETLIITNIRLKNVPEEIGKLKKLRILNLSRNRLSSLPQAIGDLPSLSHLDIGFNLLDSLPANMCNLNNIQALHVRRNQLTRLPLNFAKIASLEVLDLEDNKIRKLPYNFGRLPSLKRLDLSRNYLQTLPPTFSMLPIEVLNLRGNRISKLPATFTQLSDVREVILAKNELSAFPSDVASMKNLRILDLSGNDLVALDEDFGRAPQLHTLELSSNKLARLPRSFTALTTLRRLNLSNNYLTVLPIDMGRLTELEWLDIENNKLTEFPEIICSATKVSLRRSPKSRAFIISGNAMEDAPICFYERMDREELLDWVIECVKEQNSPLAIDGLEAMKVKTEFLPKLEIRKLEREVARMKKKPQRKDRSLFEGDKILEILDTFDKPQE